MSVITLLEKAQRINNAMPARMAQRPQVSETVIPEKEFITVKQAKEKFKIPIYLNDDDKLLLLKGDVLVKGNITRQWTEDLMEGLHWEGDAYGIFINGNLTVAGDILDDNYLHLRVSGNVICDYLFTYNGAIFIMKDLYTTFGLYGEYNDGMLDVLGNTNAPYFVEVGHYMPDKSKVTEFIFVEAENETEQEDCYLHDPETGYLEESWKLLRQEVWEENELFSYFSVNRFFQLVKNGENPLISVDTYKK